MEGTWDTNEGAVANELGNDSSWSFLLLALGKVHELNEYDDGDLDESHQESNIWVIELLWVADDILHHVDSVSCLPDTLPVEKHHTEEKAKVDSHVILKLWVKFVHRQDATNKSHLDDKEEESSVDDIHLIVNLELELLLVFLHKSEEANGIHVSRHLHGLLLDILVVVVTAGSVVLVDSSDQWLSVFISSKDHGLNLVHELALINIGVLWEIKEFLKHEIFFPLELDVVPSQIHVSNLEEHVEMESYVKQHNWSPPNGVFSLKLKEDNNQEEVDQKDASNKGLERSSKSKVLAIVERAH